MKNLKKALTVLTAILAVLSLGACSKKDDKTIESEDNMVNPWVEVNSLEQAKEKTGFEFVVPNDVNGKTISLIQIKGNDMTEVRFGDDIIVRKSKGSDDNSGDFNKYDVTKEETIDSNDVVIKGKDDVCYCITWNISDYSYSITSNNGLSIDTVKEMASSIK